MKRFLLIMMQLLAIFEVSCHPNHSEHRARSTITILDSLIAGLGLLDMDSHEKHVTTFGRNAVPSLTLPSHHPAHVPSEDYGVADGGCSCSLFKISTTSPSSKKITPFWLSTPGWSKDWDMVETKREEQRRLVWCALTLGAAHLSYFSSVDDAPLNLAITKPWNVRASLLYHSCPSIANITVIVQSSFPRRNFVQKPYDVISGFGPRLKTLRLGFICAQSAPIC